MFGGLQFIKLLEWVFCGTDSKFYKGRCKAVSDQLFGALFERLGEKARFETPLDVLVFLNPSAVVTPALELMNQRVMEWIRRPGGKLVITMLPQQGKSTFVIATEAWLLYHNVDLKIMSASYGESLTERNGAAVKAAVEAMGLRISREKASKTAWALDGKSDSFFATTMAGGATGHTADVLIIDDPVKGDEAVQSEKQRESIKEVYRSTFSTRVPPRGHQLMILTRWHDDDLAGYLLGQDTGWELLNIPAQCVDEESDPLGRELGEYLLSTRGHTVEDWEAVKKSVGSRSWAAMYQGDPVPASGNLVDPEWVGVVPRSKAPSPGMGQWVMSWDLAFGGTSTSDFTVGQVWCKVGSTLYLVDQVKGQWTFPKALEQFRAFQVKYPYARLKLVEAKANGQALIDSLKTGGVLGLVPVSPRDSKLVRVSAISPYLEAGNVVLVDGPWTSDLLSELSRFPYGKNDDQVDALAQAVLYFERRAVKVKKKRYFIGV